MKERILFALLIVLVGVVHMPAGASAYPPGGPRVVTPASVYEPGATVDVSAEGFNGCVGEEIVFTVTSPTGVVTIIYSTVGSDGTAFMSLPAGSVGDHQVRAESGCGWATTTFAVQPVAPAPPDKPLPGAGTDSRAMLRSAAAAVFGGFGLWFVARRRRHRGA